MRSDDRDDTTLPGGAFFLLCRNVCPDSPDWICELRAGHPGRHEANDGDDWWEAYPPVTDSGGQNEGGALMGPGRRERP